MRVATREVQEGPQEGRRGQQPWGSSHMLAVAPLLDPQAGGGSFPASSFSVLDSSEGPPGSTGPHTAKIRDRNQHRFLSVTDPNSCVFLLSPLRQVPASDMGEQPSRHSVTCPPVHKLESLEQTYLLVGSASLIEPGQRGLPMPACSQLP